jgi:hypothetical protein
MKIVLALILLCEVTSKIVPFTFLTSIYTEEVCASIGSFLTTGSHITILGLNNMHPIEAVPDKLFGFRMNPNWYDNRTHLLHKNKATIMKVCCQSPCKFKQVMVKIQVLVFERFLNTNINMKQCIYDDDDIVLFSDGSDVLFNSNLKEIEKLYLSIEQPNTVLFNGENTCFPKHAACFTNSADTSEHTPFRYVNSGCWMARWHVVRRFVPLWAEYIRRYSTTLRSAEVANKNATDQGALHMYASDVAGGGGLALSLDHSAPLVVVDSGCKIFQTTVNTAMNTPRWKGAAINSAKGNSPKVYVDAKSGEVHNDITHTRPVILHFNGVVAKPYVKPIASFLARNHAAIKSVDDIRGVIQIHYDRYPELKYCDRFWNTLLVLREDE